jgi:hypothetical protein
VRRSSRQTIDVLFLRWPESWLNRRQPVEKAFSFFLSKRLEELDLVVVEKIQTIISIFDIWTVQRGILKWTGEDTRVMIFPCMLAPRRKANRRLVNPVSRIIR